MFKYLLIFFVLWCKIRANDMNNQTDNNITWNVESTSLDFVPWSPASQLPLNSNTQNSTEEPFKKPLSMIGYNNYVGQQILNVYDSQFFTRLLSNKNGSFTSGNTSTHKVYRYNATWNQARETCNRHGGHLAIINSESEERILSYVLEENNLKSAWLGLHDLFEEGNWVSVLDEPLLDTGYFKWTTEFDLPDTDHDELDCGIIIKNKGITDDACYNKRSFFCEFSTQNY